MILEEFKVGEVFRTESGEWICLDKGTRTVLAIKKEEYNTVENWDCQSDKDIIVFYPYDFGGCFLIN